MIALITAAKEYEEAFELLAERTDRLVEMRAPEVLLDFRILLGEIQISRESVKALVREAEHFRHKRAYNDYAKRRKQNLRGAEKAKRHVPLQGFTPSVHGQSPGSGRFGDEAGRYVPPSMALLEQAAALVDREHAQKQREEWKSGKIPPGAKPEISGEARKSEDAFREDEGLDPEEKDF